MGKRWQYIEPGSEEIKGDWVLVMRSRSHGVLPWQPTYAEQWAMEAEARTTWAMQLCDQRATLHDKRAMQLEDCTVNARGFPAD